MKGDKGLQGRQKAASRGATEPKLAQRYATGREGGFFLEL